jgi:hypothetical protein
MTDRMYICFAWLLCQNEISPQCDSVGGGMLLYQALTHLATKMTALRAYPVYLLKTVN